MGRLPGKPSRKVSKRSVRPSILILTEGHTEEQYLTYWARLHRDRVVVTFGKYYADPSALVTEAERRRKLGVAEEKRGLGSSHDEVWCVFDRDEHTEFDKACETAAGREIEVAYSVPCIELWFLLHFQAQSADLHRDLAQRLVRPFLKNDKKVSQAEFDDMLIAYPEAVSRAKFLTIKHSGDGNSLKTNPSSNLWMLVERIRGEVEP